MRYLYLFFLASETIHLKREDHIKWHVKDFQRSSGLTLRMRFKAAKPDGVLFYTKRGGNIVVVELEKGFLRVAGGKATESKDQLYGTFSDTTKSFFYDSSHQGIS